MSFYEHDDAVRSILRRAALLKDADDAGTQQKVDIRGYKGDEPEAVHRPQMPGLHSVALKGAEGVYLEMGGRSDRALFLGGEHKDHKPKGKAPGDTVLYDHHGNAVSLVKANLRIVHATKLELVAPVVIIEAATKVVLKSAAVHLGDEGGKAVDRTDNDPSTKVKAV